MFTTSDLITYVVNYNKYVANALKGECALTLTEYRIIAYLSDHVEGAGSSELARALRVSAATVTVAANMLVNRGFIEKGDAHRARLSIKKAGIDIARDADLVLARAHEEYFAALTPRQKAVVDTGSMITNMNSKEGNRMRDGHFFSAFETLHAFLIVEEFLTVSAHEESLSLNGFRILFELGQRGGSETPSKIGAFLLLPGPVVTYAVNKLEGADLVERTATTGDKRSRTIRMTDAGTAVLERAFVRIEAVFTTDIRSSGATERESYKDAAAIVASSMRKKQLHVRR